MIVNNTPWVALLVQNKMLDKGINTVLAARDKYMCVKNPHANSHHVKCSRGVMVEDNCGCTGDVYLLQVSPSTSCVYLRLYVKG